ncbi:hypothetical protein GCM10011397_09090 [Wenyingzhuangia marina]|nr:hypothetical protein GCM10011397_09090 [Wenyingzhuangia marina]
MLLFCANAFSQQVDTLKIYSPLMEKDIKTIVVTPSKKKNLPIVYILHGYSGYPQRTLKKDIPSLLELSVKYEMIFVLPDGNYDSWYFDSPIKNSKYEGFITSELVRYIHHKYDTKNAQKAIMGWSMGGHGALYLGARHPQIFSAIGVICGAIDFVPYGEKYGIPKILGNSKKHWKNYTALSQIEKLKNSNQKLLISCGIDDPFIDENRKLHKKLIQLGIPHIYEESSGKHNAKYWSMAAKTQLFFLNEIFRSNEY